MRTAEGGRESHRQIGADKNINTYREIYTRIETERGMFLYEWHPWI